MFRAVPLPIIRSLFTVHSAVVYVIQVCRQLSIFPSWSSSKAVFKPVWHIPLLSVQWINSWRWAEELPEICRFLCRSEFGKLVHLVGIIIKKFVTMHGHTNVKLHLTVYSILSFFSTTHSHVFFFISEESTTTRVSPNGIPRCIYGIMYSLE